jgi:Photosynthesis system II assembly factor YCF48
VQEKNERTFYKKSAIRADPFAPVNRPSMANLSKMLRSRLARDTEQKDAGHPDANLLAAFAENTLMKQERAAVLTHLVRCPDCREYLAIASRVVETESPASLGAGTHPRAHSFSPAWRWAAGAAVALGVVAVIWQLRIGPPAGAQNQESPAAIMPANAENPAISAMLKMQTETAASQLAKAKSPKLARRSSKPAEVPPTAVSKAIPAASKANLDQTENLMRFRVPEEKSAEPAASAFDSNSTQAQRKDIAIDQRFGSVSTRLARESPVRANVLWSINASPSTSGNMRGSVQRSFDGGNTWEVVAVSDSVNFRAVAAEGLNVWAGGSDGALFHSSDRGLHWAQVQVAEGNVELRGTIVSIDTHKPSQITVKTDLGEEWISVDGGLHWRRSL